ncbi:sulfotransferase [Pseudozobellia sp. WGM2]|uniref:sulfotransferase n=1 Tax=Pseudozobellia sp. WGM2 TaxID=2787625 RepID=UPI001AE0272B|nr:sulfotransferase [Pseudozobellia sp. WGM2]
MSYSNFKDPIGLLKRMLLSGNKIAYFVLLREFLAKVLVPLDFLLQNREKKIIKSAERKENQPIILVLGGSRSGTTLLYQTLAYYLPVSYISNFIAAFERSPIAAYKTFNRFIPKPKKKFKSYYGSVSGSGGPNDAFHLWNRWLGEDRNHIPAELDQHTKLDMQSFFNAWSGISKKPFLNKNNRNSLCSSDLYKSLNNIYFVEIYRNPIYVAQSLILSRREVQGNHEIGWGLLSKDHKKNGDPLGYINDVCNQVNAVNQAIDKERKKIDPERYFRVSFENFCENPSLTVRQVSMMALGIDINSENLDLLKFSKNPNKQRLTDVEFNRILHYFKNS